MYRLVFFFNKVNAKNVCFIKDIKNILIEKTHYQQHYQHFYVDNLENITNIFMHYSCLNPTGQSWSSVFDKNNVSFSENA